MRRRFHLSKHLGWHERQTACVPDFAVPIPVAEAVAKLRPGKEKPRPPPDLGKAVQSQYKIAAA